MVGTFHNFEKCVCGRLRSKLKHWILSMHTGRFFLYPYLFVFVFLGVCFPYWLSHIFSHLLWFILPLCLAIQQDDSLFGPDHKIIYRPPAIFCIVPELAFFRHKQPHREKRACFRIFSMHVNALTVIYKSWLTGHKCLFLKGRHICWKFTMFTQAFHPFFCARHFATLYFIFVADSAESELGVLDLIQASANSFVSFACSERRP